MSAVREEGDSACPIQSGTSAEELSGSFSEAAEHQLADWATQDLSMQRTHVSSILQVPTFNTTLRGRVLLDLFSEPDIFNIKWDQLQAYNGIIYPALPDLYGPTMNVSCPSLSPALPGLTRLCPDAVRPRTNLEQ